MLCNALQRAVHELSFFLAKPYQPNGHDGQMILVDPLEVDKSDTPNTHRHLWHRFSHRPAHDHDHNHNHSPDSLSLGSHDPDLGPQHSMHVGYSSTT